MEHRKNSEHPGSAGRKKNQKQTWINWLQAAGGGGCRLTVNSSLGKGGIELYGNRKAVLNSWKKLMQSKPR